MRLIRLFSLIILKICIVRGDVFTSTAHLTQLLSTETGLIKELRHYLNDEYRRLNRIEKVIHQLQDEIDAIRGHEEDYFAHPMNTYLFIKDFTSAWSTIKPNLPSNYSEYVQHQCALPDQDDTEGSAVALMRLQDTYELTTSQLASGDWHPKYQSRRLNALECFEIGRVAFVKDDYYHSLMWLQEALDKLDQNPKDKSVKRIDVLDYLASMTIAQKNFDHAMALTEEILMTAPRNEVARTTQKFLESRAKNDSLQSNSTDGTTEGLSSDATETIATDRKKNYTIQNPRAPSTNEDIPQYEYLCRFNESRTIANDTSRLYCRYRHNNHPYLILQPVKEEQLSEDPPIFVFYDVIREKKIKTILSIATERLQRAKVVSANLTSNEYASYRISKSAWIYDGESYAVALLSHLVGATSHLDIHMAEPLQLANYGIGGHYEPHYDFFNSTANYVVNYGDRIATWLTYLSDVERGGGTAFPKVGVHVKAQKGSAAFWYNLRGSLTVDERTMHAGCPVLIGNKWVANKWIRSHGQEFMRPCPLDPNM